MALLKSRPLATGFESLQLSESLTLAEETLKEVLKNSIDSYNTVWLHREIILPVGEDIYSTSCPAEKPEYNHSGSRVVYFRGVVKRFVKPKSKNGVEHLHHVIAMVNLHLVYNGIWKCADVHFWESEAHQIPRKYQGWEQLLHEKSVGFYFSPIKGNSTKNDSCPPPFLV